jgi:hypothetical protein
MADKLVAHPDDNSVIRRFVDNGDGTWSEKVAVGSLVATNGDSFNADGATTYSYNADDTIAYVQIAATGGTYRQTWTWTAGLLTSTTGWIKQ